MTSNPRTLFRKVLDETSDPVAAIRAVREVFGLSVSDAKDVWIQATGQAATLSEHQEQLAAALPRIACPKCLSDTTVVRKMHALPTSLGYGNAGSVELLNLNFVNGFWCSDCQLGFVPDHMLDDLGLVRAFLGVALPLPRPRSFNYARSDASPFRVRDSAARFHTASAIT